MCDATPNNVIFSRSIRVKQQIFATILAEKYGRKLKYLTASLTLLQFPQVAHLRRSSFTDF